MSKNEVSSLGKYLVSPIFNTNEKAVRLFQLVKRHYPRFDAPDLSKDEVFRRMFPEKKVMDSSLRALMSQLTNLVTEFLSFQEYNRRKFLKNELLVLALMERNLIDLFRKALQSAQKELEKHKYRDTEIYHHMFRLSIISFEHDIVYKNREPGESLNKVVNDLDTFFISSKLRYSAATINRQLVIDEAFNLSLFEEILSFVQDSPLRETPLVKLYYLMCLMLLDRESETRFYELKELVETHKDSVSIIDTRQVYTVLINFCLTQVKIGKEEFLRETFVLYKQMIQQDLLRKSNKYMSVHHYRNIAMVAIRLKEFEWAEDFMESYKNKLETEDRKDIYAYLKAALSFEMGQYEKAKEYLLDFHLIDVFYHLHWKILMIKTYYELNENTALESAIEAFRIYLLREKSLARNNITSCQRFVNLVKKVHRRKNAVQTKDISDLLDEINSNTNTAELAWIRQKATELQK